MLIIAGIPAYNEEETIGRVVALASDYVDKVLVVDDGSSDMTAKIAEEEGAIVVRHRKNRGIGPTRSTIARRSLELNADVLVTLDGDGQHDPNDIPKVVDPILKDEADICVGCRILNKGHMPVYRRFGLRILNKAISLAVGKKIRDTQSGFVAFSKKALKAIGYTQKGMSISVDFWYEVVRKGLTFQEVPIVINYRQVNGSTINPISHAWSILLLLVKRMAQDHPFLLLGVPGVILVISGLVVMEIVLRTYFASKQLSLGLMMSSVLVILLGTLLILVSIILFVLSDILLRIERKIES